MAKKKKLFKDTSAKYWSNNACIGGQHTSGYTYALSYLKAADILVDIALKGSDTDKDYLFYTICFNYRHFIEVSLKELVIIAEKFYKKSEYLGYEIKKYTDLKSDLLIETHSLEKLLKWLVNVLECVSKEKIDQEVYDLITDYHNVDPDGQKFRYPLNTKKQPSFPQRTFYDLSHLKNEMKRIEGHFMGIDGWIDHYSSIADGLLSSLTN